MYGASLVTPYNTVYKVYGLANSIFSTMLSSFLNGIGDVNVQMYANVIAVVINIPVSVFLAVTCNLKTAGICLGTVVSLFINIILAIQIRRIFKRLKNNK